MKRNRSIYLKKQTMAMVQKFRFFCLCLCKLDLPFPCSTLQSALVTNLGVLTPGPPSICHVPHLNLIWSRFWFLGLAFVLFGNKHSSTSYSWSQTILTVLTVFDLFHAKDKIYTKLKLNHHHNWTIPISGCVVFNFQESRILFHFSK